MPHALPSRTSRCWAPGWRCGCGARRPADRRLARVLGPRATGDRYLGPLAGRVGFAVQRLCLRPPGPQLHLLAAGRGAAAPSVGHRAPVVRLTGEYAERPVGRTGRASRPPRAATRRWSSSPAGTSPRSGCWQSRRDRRGARGEMPGPALRDPRRRARHRGDRGPGSPELGLEDVVEIRGRVEPRGGDAARSRLRVLSAAPLRARGLRRWSSSRPPRSARPTVVVDGPENAATELVEAGVNGFVAASRPTEEIGRRCRPRPSRAAAELRDSTRRVVPERNREQLSFESSMRRGRGDLRVARASP